jgi:hypothetical protein
MATPFPGGEDAIVATPINAVLEQSCAVEHGQRAACIVRDYRTTEHMGQVDLAPSGYLGT